MLSPPHWPFLFPILPHCDQKQRAGDKGHFAVQEIMSWVLNAYRITTSLTTLLVSLKFTSWSNLQVFTKMLFCPTTLNTAIARILSTSMVTNSLTSLQANIKLPLAKKRLTFVSVFLQCGCGRKWGNRAEKQARREEAGNSVIG